VARGVAATAAALLLALAVANPASAQLVRRGNDGTLNIDPLLCQTDYQVRQAIAAAGFKNILLNAPVNSHIRARGTKGSTVYLIDYEYCLGGGIESVEPLRAAR
jgi:hypothetical protein